MKSRLLTFFFSIIFCGIILNACQSEQEINYSRYFVNGRQIYQQHCENCHGKEGQGLQGLIPPLTDTTFLKQNRNHLAGFIKYGLSDTITVSGTSYQGKMPSESHLTNIDIAQVITFITNSFGNKQGLHDVTEVEKDLAEVK